MTQNNAKGINVPVGGDLSGTIPNPTVVGIQGFPVSPTAPSSNQVLEWNGSAYVPTTITIVTTLAGDVTGPTGSNTVINIHGASVPAAGSLTTGNVLQVSGASSLSYSAVNLAGGANYVTGVLPTGNQASQSLSGDLSGTTASATVIKLQGNAVQSGANGAAQDGYILTWVNGSSQFQVKPAVSQTLRGDASGTIAAVAVLSLTGTGTNGYTGSGTNVNVAATETVIASSSTAPVKSSAGTVNTTDGTTWFTISSWTPEASTIEDLSITLAARSATNDGYYYRADVFVTVSRTGSSTPILDPSVPTASNIRSNGNVLAVRVVLSSNIVQIQVQGFASNTYHWSCVEQHVIIT